MTRYEKEAKQRFDAGLAVVGEWTFTAREELKKRGFLWYGKGRAWVAPSEEARDRAIAELVAEAVPRWSVTVHSDGGWKNGIGRWAWYCKTTNTAPIIGHGEGEAPGSAFCEAEAMARGLSLALDAWAYGIAEVAASAAERGLAPGKPTVFLRTDCAALLDALQRDEVPRGWRFDSVAWIREQPAAHGIVFDMKHIRGHGDNRRSTAAWVNWKVDALSSMRGR